MALYQVNAGDRILAADIVQFYNILKGVATSGEGITLIYNAAASIILQPSSDPAAGTEAIQIKNNAGTVLGSLTYDGKVKTADGTATLPSVRFQSEASGLYLSAAGTLAAAIAGVTSKLRIDATGVSADTGSNYLDQLAVIDQRKWYRFRYEPLGTGAINGVNVGTGAIAALAGGRGQTMTTGTTNPSSCSQRIVLVSSGGVPTIMSRVRRVEFQASISDTLASANAYLYMTDESADTAPSATARHVGIKNLNGTVSFTTADGTTEEATDVTASTTTNIMAFIITFDGTTAKLYIDGTLRATHSTKVPIAGGASAAFRAFINNNASVNSRVLTFYATDALFLAA